VKNLLTRTATGALFVLAVVFGTYSHPITFLVLFCTIMSFSMYELYVHADKKKIHAQKYYSILVAILFFVANFLFAQNVLDATIFVAFIPLVMFIFIAELFLKHSKPTFNVAYTIFGLVYICLPFSFLNYIAFSAINGYVFNPLLILSLLVIIWANDTGAYLSGMSFGKHKLFERISPKKTWEGSVGGLFSAFITGYIFSRFITEIPTIHWIIMSGIVAVSGTLGDLIESQFKRMVEIKDSGKILPGHGGMFDRFDALIFAIPPFFTYLQFLTNSL